MRASTLFALTAAIVLGLAVATAAKYTGFFNGPPPPAPPAKKPDTQILAAAKNLFAGQMIDQTGVRVRPLRPEEAEDYEKNKDQYLPAVPAAAVLRIPHVNIYADQPMRKDQLKEMAQPEPLHARLLPNMRAVNLSLPKERSAGGQVQVGEWVDVFLTSEVEYAQMKVVRTACIAPKVRVIAKRNTLWPLFAPLPENKPVDFTLETNPYRAALIESTRAKGDLAIAPLGASEQRQLEVQRARLLENPDQPGLGHFLSAGSPEAEEEDARLAAFLRGEAVSERDLVRIFGLQTPPPPLATISVERVSGYFRLDPQLFTANGDPIANGPRLGASAPPSAKAGGEDSAFQFRAPDCPTCKNKKK